MNTGFIATKVTRHGKTAVLRSALAVAVGVLTLCSGQTIASAQDGGSSGAPPGSHSTGKGKFAKLTDAVTSGRLDQEVVDALATSGTVDALVMVDDDSVAETATASTAASADHDAQVIDKMRTEFGARKQRSKGRHSGDLIELQDFDNLPVTQVRITSVKSLLSLINDADISAIRTIHTMEAGSMDPESAALVRQPQATAAGYGGAGTYVAVLDSGVDYTRSDFGSCTAPNTPATCRVAVSYDVAPDDNTFDADPGLHGTNVAGIVAGIAPATKILALDVFDTTGHTNDSYMLKAMNDLIAYRRSGVNIVAANLSIWTPGQDWPGACNDNLHFGVARAAGIIPVVIAGNGGSTLGISYPGCMPGALTVGAVYDSNLGSMPTGGGRWLDGNCSDSVTFADKVVCFSQSGPTLKMLAPGSSITAAGVTESGTSQAAPHVAGAVAVMAAAKPAAGVNGWEYALVNSGPTIVDRDGKPRHRLDVYASLQTLLGSADTTAPVVVAPSQGITLNSTAEAAGISVTIDWSATDANGIAAYSLESSTNGGAWVIETLSTATTTSKAFLLAPGSSYQFAVAAKDGAGNWSTWAYGPAFNVADFAENNGFVSYSTGWVRAAWTSAYGGFVTSASATNASASFTFTGRSVAWVSSKSTNRGVANVYLDGAYVGQWNLYSATTVARSVVLAGNWATTSTHTLKVVVAGTAGHPTIDVDSFILLG